MGELALVFEKILSVVDFGVTPKWNVEEARFIEAAKTVEAGTI